MRKRIRKPIKINLDLLYPIASSSAEIDSDSEYDYRKDSLEEFDLEELEEMGAISYPETKKTIPDGEQAFFSAIKNGEDW